MSDTLREIAERLASDYAARGLMDEAKKAIAAALADAEAREKGKRIVVEEQLRMMTDNARSLSARLATVEQERDEAKASEERQYDQSVAATVEMLQMRDRLAAVEQESEHRQTDHMLLSDDYKQLALDVELKRQRIDTLEQALRKIDKDNESGWAITGYE